MVLSLQSNPIQSNPIQSNPIQSNPIQSNPIQVHLNIVFGFTALESSENAFFLRNQGKGVFIFLDREGNREIPSWEG